MSDVLPEPTAAPPAAAEAEKPFLGGRSFDLLMGLGVLAISMISLFVAVSANRTQERMLAASVWPSLMFGTSNVSTDGQPQLAFDLLNRGVGPARIRWAELSYDGVPVRGFDELRRKCCEGSAEFDSFTSGLQRRILAADEWMQIVRVPREGTPEALWKALDAGRHKVKLRACYCSVLDDCWVLDSDTDEPAPVAQCPAAPGVLWGVKD